MSVLADVGHLLVYDQKKAKKNLYRLKKRYIFATSFMFNRSYLQGSYIKLI